MSFSAEIKQELMKIEDMPDCCAHAMAYGMLLFGRSFDSGDISLLTDNPSVADSMLSLLKGFAALPA